MFWLQNLPQSLRVPSLKTSCSRARRQPDPGQQLGIAIRVVRVGLPEEECPAPQDQRDHPGLLISFHQPCLVIRFAVESDYDEFESFLTALTTVVSARLKREAAFLYLAFNQNTQNVCPTKAKSSCHLGPGGRAKRHFVPSLIMSITTSYPKSEQVWSNLFKSLFNRG